MAAIDVAILRSKVLSGRESQVAIVSGTVESERVGVSVSGCINCGLRPRHYPVRRGQQRDSALEFLTPGLQVKSLSILSYVVSKRILLYVIVFRVLIGIGPSDLSEMCCWVACSTIPAAFRHEMPSAVLKQVENRQK